MSDGERNTRMITEERIREIERRIDYLNVALLQTLELVKRNMTLTEQMQEEWLMSKEEALKAFE